jgi:hypothetical protein
MAKKNTMGASPYLSGENKDWRAEDDLRCLMNADEIKEDPKRFEAAKALAREKLVDMAKISVMAGDKPEANDKD